MNSFNIQLFKKIPKCVLSYMFINYLDIDSIKNTIIYFPKLFNKNQKNMLKNINRGFWFCCMNGSFNEAKIIYSTNNIDIHYNNDEIFMWSCCSGILEIAKWIYSLDSPNNFIINRNNNYAFTHCCDNNFIDVVKWLYSLYVNNNIKIDVLNNFCGCCFTGKLELAQWLYYTSNLDLYKYYDDIFVYSCNKGFLDVAKWLYSLNNNINIHARFNWAFKTGNLYLLKWLKSIDNQQK